MNEFQKEALLLLKEVSLQLVLIAVGAISLVGSVMASRTKTSARRGFLKWAMKMMMISVFLGLVTLGHAISQLTAGSFDPWTLTMRVAYFGQLAAVLIGGALLAGYLYRNTP